MMQFGYPGRKVALKNTILYLMVNVKITAKELTMNENNDDGNVCI